MMSDALVAVQATTGAKTVFFNSDETGDGPAARRPHTHLLGRLDDFRHLDRQRPQKRRLRESCHSDARRRCCAPGNGAHADGDGEQCNDNDAATAGFGRQRQQRNEQFWRRTSPSGRIERRRMR
jgi:hypothetical protein